MTWPPMHTFSYVPQDVRVGPRAIAILAVNLAFSYCSNSSSSCSLYCASFQHHHHTQQVSPAFFVQQHPHPHLHPHRHLHPQRQWAGGCDERRRHHLQLEGRWNLMNCPANGIGGVPSVSLSSAPGGPDIDRLRLPAGHQQRLRQLCTLAFGFFLRFGERLLSPRVARDSRALPFILPAAFFAHWVFVHWDFVHVLR